MSETEHEEVEEQEEQEGEDGDPLADVNERLARFETLLGELRQAQTPKQEESVESSIEDYFAQRGVSKAEIEAEIERLNDEREYGRFKTMSERLGAELAAEAEAAGYEEEPEPPKPKPRAAKPKPKAEEEEGEEDEPPGPPAPRQRSWEPFP